jgi:hypothetical protein
MMKKNILLSMIMFVLLMGSASAFGVSSPYWEPDEPFTISPGESRDAILTLQNMAGTNDITVRATITDGEEVASLAIDEYTVEGGSKDTEVAVRITIPEDVLFAAEYKVTVSFQTVTDGASGGIALGTGMDIAFPVRVIAPTPSPEVEGPFDKNTVWLVIGLIVIVLIVWYVLRKEKHKKKSKKH